MYGFRFEGLGLVHDIRVYGLVQCRKFVFRVFFVLVIHICVCAHTRTHTHVTCNVLGTHLGFSVLFRAGKCFVRIVYVRIVLYIYICMFFYNVHVCARTHTHSHTHTHTHTLTHTHTHTHIRYVYIYLHIYIICTYLGLRVQVQCTILEFMVQFRAGNLFSVFFFFGNTHMCVRAHTHAHTRNM